MLCNFETLQTSQKEYKHFRVKNIKFIFIKLCNAELK